MVKKWISSDIVVLIKRLLILYALFFVCRVLFYLNSSEIIGTIEWAELWTLIRGATQFDSVSIIYANAVFILLSLLPLKARETGWYRAILFWYYVVVNAVVMAINLCDAVYFRYTQSRFTAHEFFFVENDNTSTLVWKFLGENWLLALAWVALVASMVWLYRKSGKPVTPIKNSWTYTIVSTVILLAALTISLWTVRGCSLSRDVRPITITNANAYTPSPTKATMILSNPFCILRTMGNSPILAKEYFTPEELATIYTPYHYPNPSDTLAMGGTTFGMMKGRNVVIFILESFSNEHSALLNPDLYPNGKGYMPFLDSLMVEGYTMRSAFASGHKSIDALPSVWSSIPSYKTPFVLLPTALKDGMQLPKILREDGYETAFFCGSPNGSMGFDAYSKAAGINQIYSMDTYHENHEDNFDGYWGIWDEHFIDYMGEVLNTTPQPFLSTIFTLNSHHPFQVPSQYEKTLPEGKTKVQKPVAYTDQSIRKFFERYGNEPWFANTTFVFVGDHVSSERFAAKTETPLGMKHIITFLYTPDGSLRGMDDTAFEQIDIMPTILGLLGYDKPYFGFGRDIFNEPERMALAMSYDGTFQGISDSLSVFFDEEHVVGAFSRRDTLQKNNIASPSNAHIVDMEQIMKAKIQQYYDHMSGGGKPFKAPQN